MIINLRNKLNSPSIRNSFRPLEIFNINYLLFKMLKIYTLVSKGLSNIKIKKRGNIRNMRVYKDIVHNT